MNTERYIVPLDLMDSVMDKSASYLRSFIGEKEPRKYIASYIGGAKKKILVDTGPPSLEHAIKYHSHAAWQPRRPGQEIASQLSKVGVRPEEIDLVILTHLHWDHVGTVTQFPNAQFIVSKEELRFALDPVPCLYATYEALQIGMQPEFLKVMDRIRTVEMKEQEILDGIRLMPLPGHSPGLMGVVVETDEGPYVIASDSVCMYGNLHGVPEKKQAYFMSGTYVDMLASWNSYELIDKIVDHDFSRAIPGHDPLVFNRQRYP